MTMENKDETSPIEETPVEETPIEDVKPSEEVDEKPSVEEINKNLISEIKEIRKERTDVKAE